MKPSQQSTPHQMASDVNRIIRSEHSRNRAGKLIAVLAIPVVVAVLLFLLWPAEAVPVWQTHAIDRGDMILTATATGSLEPKSEVSVGAEISGRITQVLVSDNDHVSKGQTLALFDTDELNVALDQAEAQLALAKASLAEAEATLKEALAGERRTNELWDRGTAAQADVDAAAAVRQRSEAKVAYARASVRQAQASVSQARTRLEKAVIRSPIDGVVLQRSIEPGNTVAASFQAPVLFLLAEDLGQMELHVSMDEADVGLVEAGQPATFTVDAWAGRQFQARVLKVYLYPNIENNVVTYTTVLSVDNRDGLLKPGMTATATIETGRRQGVLRVPNAAFRFTPPSQSADTGGLFRHPAGRAGNGRSGPSNTVWLLKEGKPERKVVSTGATDGLYTELTGNELSAGDEVIVGVTQASAK